MPEITTTPDPSAEPTTRLSADSATRIEELYATLLENLRGFDHDEIGGMDRDDLLAHWEAASRAFVGLDDELVAGRNPPLDWQPVENTPVAALPSASATQSA